MPDNEDMIISWFHALCHALNGPPGKRSFCDCLNLASQSISHLEFQRVFGALTEVVRLEIPLSNAMELFPTMFSPKQVAVVRYGEMYGELDLTLERYVERPEDRASRCQIPA